MKQGDPWRGQKPWQTRWERMWLRGRRNNNCFRSSWPVQISPSSAPPSNPPHARPAPVYHPVSKQQKDPPDLLPAVLPESTQTNRKSVVSQTEQVMPRELCAWHARARVLGYPTWEGEAHIVIFSWSFGLCLYQHSRVTLCFLWCQGNRNHRVLCSSVKGLRLEWSEGWHKLLNYTIEGLLTGG